MVIDTLCFYAETLTCLQFAIKIRSSHRADKKCPKQEILLNDLNRERLICRSSCSSIAETSLFGRSLGFTLLSF